MDIIIVLIVLGIGGYYFLKSNTRRGAETVRAYLYLVAIRAGKTAEDAKRLASFDMSDAPTEVIRGAVRAVKNNYGGKQHAMISEAYSYGMIPKLPAWHRRVMDLHSAEKTAQHSRPATASISDIPSEPTAALSFESYQEIVLAEAKRIDGKSPTDLHWIELADDEGTRRAYDDGIEPKWLAAAILKNGPPPPF